MYRRMTTLAIILARGGSKRIPRKNIRPFGGKPVMAYPLAAARESGCFDEIMVSTDDAEIASIAREHGAVVPFLRSEANANDHAGSDDAIAEVILRYRELGRDFDQVCALYPTAVLTTAGHLREGRARLLADQALTCVHPVLRFSFPIQRALVMRNGRTPMLQPEHVNTRSQDLEPTFHDAGQWYWLRPGPFLRTRELIGSNCAGFELSALEAQDIDNEDDWAMAELKYQLRQPLHS
ncbi:MAG: pseudaminic acid cytidylyltransferase [Verrucomicrobiota bacterium]